MLLRVNNRRLKKKYLADINDKQSMDDLIQIHNTKKDGHYDFLRPSVCKKKIVASDVDVGAGYKNEVH